jgi:flagellar hook assembly protein FlgD
MVSDEETQDFPRATILEGNYPNPFNPTTSIQYALSEDTRVTIRIYNMLGQLVATLVDEDQTAGYKSVAWNGRNAAGSSVASGIYLYKLNAGNFVQTKRMLLLK